MMMRCRRWGACADLNRWIWVDSHSRYQIPHRSELSMWSAYRLQIGHDIRSRHLLEGAMKQQLGRSFWPARGGVP